MKEVTRQVHRLNALLIIVIAMAITLGGAAGAATLFSDNFSDARVATPTYSPTGAEWVVSTGQISAGSLDGFNFFADGYLMFKQDVNVKASVNFAATVAGAPVEARFKLVQLQGSPAFYLFNFGFKNTTLNKSIYQMASPAAEYFGTPGNGTGFDPGGVVGTHLSRAEWDCMKIDFTPATQAVDVWLSKDNGVSYVKVASWTDTQNLTSVNQFFFDCQPGNTGLQWVVDDVEISELPVATPTFTPDGGPHVQNAYPLSVTINCLTAEASIYYTTNNSEPSTTNGTLIAPGGSISVPINAVLKAKAYKAGYSASATKSATYIAGTLFSDNFSDQLVATPTYSPGSTEWIIGAGLVTAGSDEPSGFGHSTRDPGTLMFTNAANTKVSVNFGATIANTPIEVRFKVAQNEGAGGSYLFNFGLKNTTLNQSVYQMASPNVSYFGPTGGGSGFDPGGVMWMGYHLSLGGWDYMKMVFNPTTHVVDTWQSTDGGVNYAKVATWTDTQNLASVNQFFFDCLPGFTGVSWRADDVSIAYWQPTVTTPTLTPGTGNLQGPTPVTIACATPDATIRYTTDGTEPNETSTIYTEPVTAGDGTTIKAKAFKFDYNSSNVASATYYIWNPVTIAYSNSIVVDGNLSEWSESDFATIDKLYWVPEDYPAYPISVTEAKYAAKWREDKVYVAVKVNDPTHYLTNAFTTWDGQDDVEVYIHTPGSTGPTSFNALQEAAQQFLVGVQPGGTTSWSVMGGHTVTPASAGLTRAVSVNGTWLNYEVAMTPWQYFGGLASQTSVPYTLKAGDNLGLDVTVFDMLDRWTYAGQLSENLMRGKSGNYNQIATHLLVGGLTYQAMGITDAKHAADGTLVEISSGAVSQAFADYFYIETTDRSSGIRVKKTAHGLAQSQIITKVTGEVKTDPDTLEKYIQATDTIASGFHVIDPLAGSNRGLAGGGLEAVGLYVKAWGKVTSLGGGIYKLNDGSDLDLRFQIVSGSLTVDPAKAYSVTGPLSLYKVPTTGPVVKLIIVKDATTDIKAL